MRLTLRALLAYLYNVLEPADADEFAGKVKESAVASGLVQRIGGITHKMRMSAPRIDAKGMVDDANHVAQYLDNSLPDEQVGDFERACINSDMHLAEVASSYQILTMVLGKPADTSEALHTRIYRLPLDIATSHKAEGDGETPERQRLKKTMEKVAQSAKQTDAGVQAARSSSSYPAAEVPDYLRDGQKSSKGLWWLGVGAVVVLAAALGIRAAGPYDSNNPIIGRFFAPPSQVAQSGPTEPEQSKSPEVKRVEADAADQKKSPVNDNAVSKETGSKPVDASETKSTKDEHGEKIPAPMDDGKNSEEAASTTPVPPMPEAAAAPPVTSAPGSDTKGTAKTEGKGTDTPAKTAADVPPAPPADPMDVGRYVSDDQVLTRFDAKSGLSFRVPSRALLAAGERLVVLPTYRPQITLASGVQVSFAGESAVQMEEPLHAGASRITVEYGRFLVVTLGNEGAQIEVSLQGLQGMLTLEDSSTVLAIDVRHFLPPGSSAEMDARVQVVEIFATSGSARWEESGKEPLDIPEHHVVSYVAGQERELSGPFAAPEWIDASSLSDIDRLTSHELQRALDFDKPVHVRLAELMGDRRVDVRALAARCLAQLGEFEPLIKELSNPQQKSFWAPEVDVLRQSLTRGPETVQQIRQTLERLNPKEAATLFRLMWGFSAEQLQGSGAAELVEMLESPDMAVRVLAIDTLRQITGAQLLYRPEKATSDNRGSINRWIERQKDGSIAYKTPPAPIPERKPLAMPAAESKAPAGKSKGEK